MSNGLHTACFLRGSHCEDVFVKEGDIVNRGGSACKDGKRGSVRCSPFAY